MAVDHIVLRDRDDLAAPPAQVLALTGITPSVRGEMPMVVIEACAFDESTDASTRTRLASFTLDLDVLVDTVNAAFGEVVLLLDQAGVDEVSP